MESIENKILKAISNNKLSLNNTGERNWYNYFIVITELVWARNNHDGYQIEVYSDCSKREHLNTVKI